MGYEAPETLYELKFADGNLVGLEVMTRSSNFDQLFEIADLADRIEAGGMTAAEVKASVKQLYKEFGSRLVSWNLERKGVPIEATAEQLGQQEHPFVLALVYAWLDTMNGRIRPLEPGSDEPPTPPDVPLPMEVLPA